MNDKRFNSKYCYKCPFWNKPRRYCAKKRFTLVRVCDNQAFYFADNGEELSNEEVVDKLNELSSDSCKWSWKCAELETKNVILKNQVQEKQATIEKQQKRINELEQRDYDNQSERYKILGRAIELAADYIHRNDCEYYNFCGLVTEFENELLEGLDA